MRSLPLTCGPSLPDVPIGIISTRIPFFAGTYPTDSLKVQVKEIIERLAGSEGTTLIFKLMTCRS
jgi:hypothetical protein